MQFINSIDLYSLRIYPIFRVEDLFDELVFKTSKAAREARLSFEILSIEGRGVCARVSADTDAPPLMSHRESRDE